MESQYYREGARRKQLFVVAIVVIIVIMVEETMCCSKCKSGANLRGKKGETIIRSAYDGNITRIANAVHHLACNRCAIASRDKTLVSHREDMASKAIPNLSVGTIVYARGGLGAI